MIPVAVEHLTTLGQKLNFYLFSLIKHTIIIGFEILS